MSKQMPKKRRLYSIRELFLFKRIPKLDVSAVWEKPADFAAYDAQITASDFIVDADLDEATLRQTIIPQNLRDLKDFLLDHFFEANQQSKHYQNLYFRNQWILIFGSSVTAIVTAISIFINTTSVPTPDAAAINPPTQPPIEQTLEPTSAPMVTTNNETITRTNTSWAGILTAGAAVIIGIFTALNQISQPQAQWYKMRKIAEELRHHYFLYLMHLPPYDRADRVEILEANGIEIKQNRQSQEPDTSENTPALPLDLDDNATQKLIELYKDKRLTTQYMYYRDAVIEYKRNAEFVRVGSIIIATLPPLFTAISISFNSPFWVTMTLALLPVFGALLASFEKIYGWNRQISLYTDARDGLERNRVMLPARAKKPDEKYADILVKFVTEVENTLKNERNQWGQLTSSDATSQSNG